MNEDEFKPYVKAFLYEHGLRVRDIIPRQNSRTPDFDVKADHSEYTIELKIKSDNPAEIERDNQVLSQGQILEKATPIGPRNRLYAIIKDGVDQMKEYDPENKTFHVLWLHSEGREPDLLNTRFHSTLFGMQYLVSLEISYLMKCYFFEESAFYDYRDCLDGAILTYRDQLQLCVNTLSHRKAEFKKADLYSILSRGLCDPDILQNEQDILIADCEVDRKAQSEVIDYLRGKYSISHLQVMEMTQYSGRIAIPKKE